MSNRAQKYEAFLDDLAPILDGDPEALERHADFLADDDEARDLRHDALETAKDVGDAGADFVMPPDLEARLLAAIDGGQGAASEGERSTSPGFHAPDAARAAQAMSEPMSPPHSEGARAEGAASNATAQGHADALAATPPTNPPPAAQQEQTFPPQPQAQLYPPQSNPALASPGHASSPGQTVPLYPPHGDTRPGYSSQPIRDTRPPVHHTHAVQSGQTQVVSPPGEKKKGRMGVLLFFPIAGVAALAAAAVLGLVIFGGDDDEAPPESAIATSGINGTLEAIDRAADDGRTGVEVRRANSQSFVALASGEAVPAGAVVRTDERTRAALRMADGSRVVLNHATELALVGDAPRSYRIQRGEVVADIAHLEGAPNSLFHTPTGRVEVVGTKFELTAADDVTSVRVTRGKVTLAAVNSTTGGNTGTPSEVRAGEEGLVRSGAAPNVAPVIDLARSMAWSETLGVQPTVGEAAEDDEDTLAGIGSLRARRPGERTDHDQPLALAQHSVRVRIVGNVARTEIEEVFRNDGENVLEGIYRFPLPPDAQIARLALDVEGRMEEGSFVERDRASRIWAGVIRHQTAPQLRRNDEEFIWVPGPWSDPAILEWQRGGQFELRIFPIPAHGERRVVLAYTQTVAPQGDRRRYVYPLAHSNDGSTRVGRFDVDVRVAGAEHVSTTGYEVRSSNEDDATRMRYTENSFLPKGDLVVEYELPGAERELSWWTYRGEAAAPPPADSREEDREVSDIQRRFAEDGRGYVALALRPRLPRGGERRDRDYVIVVDSSQSMVGERFERAARLATGIVSEMDRRDRFTLLACDYQCRTMSGGMRTPSAEGSREVASWLGEIEPAGASDIVAVLREAAAGVEGERRQGREVHLMYIGDGTASVGYRRASSLAAEAHSLAEQSHVAVTTIGVGGDADTLALGAIARATGGHYVPYVPGERTSVAAMDVLETTYGVSLESPVVQMPNGVSEIAPSQLPTIRAGQEVVIVGRMDQERVQGDVVLRGRVAGRPFEQRYRVDLQPTDAAGNRFVPRLWAAGQIEEMQLRGRGDERARIVAMSKSFGVMSRHTSLLVLESEAMFRAFRVDRNTANTPVWTGEEDVVAGGTDGTVQLAEGGEGDAAGGRGHAALDDSVGQVGARGRSSGGGGYGSGEAARRPMPGRPMPTNQPPMQRAPARPQAVMAPPMENRAEMERPAEAAPMPETATAAPQGGIAQAPVFMPPPPPRGPGRWMRRVWYRAGEIATTADPTQAELDAARRAEQELEANQDSRDRHREAVRQLSRAGQLQRALEVAEAWVARDRQDAEALTAKADILGRLGRRDDALRYLTGTVDLTPSSDALHLRLANAFERAGRPERACAHHIAIAESNETNAEALAAAMRCERALDRNEAADRLMNAVRDPEVRTRAERALAQTEPEGDRFRGDFTIDADWDSDVDLDLTIVTPQGTRLSWMGGRTTVVGDEARSTHGERLGMRYTGAGNYLVEVSRTDPTDERTVSGRMRIRILGQERTVPFTLRSEREAAARVRVTREQRMENVTGTVGPQPW